MHVTNMRAHVHLIPYLYCIQKKFIALAFSFLLLSSFFVVEDTILHTTQSLAKTGSREVGDESLVTRKIVNEFWSMAQDEALAVLRSNCVSFMFT